MSKQLTRPFRPLDWVASPRDLVSDDNLELRTNDATQRFTFGTRAVSWDGSVYRYFKAGSTLVSYQAAIWHNATSAGVGFESIGGASTAGSNIVTISEASITEDQYAGGYLLLFHATGDGQVTAIRGNTASSGGKVILYLDQPLPVDVSTSDNLELYANPWSDCRSGNSASTRGFVGLPQSLTTSGSHGWAKTWGVTFISPQASVGGTGTPACYFRDDGSIDIRGNIGAGITDQYAGYKIVGSAAGDGPLIMLQVSI